MTTAADLRRLLAGRTDIRVALLFGSVATGRERPDSDVDLAVFPAGELDLLGLAAQLSASLGREVDVVDLRRAGQPLLDEVLRDGIVLHEGSRSAHAAWRTATLLQLETDRPLLRRIRDASLARLARGH